MDQTERKENNKTCSKLTDTLPDILCAHCVTFNVSDTIFSQCIPLKNVLEDRGPHYLQNGGHWDNL